MGERDATRPVDERGSVLFLFPAVLLVVIVLAAIAIDAAATFTHQRELLDGAAAAAHDAATAGLDVEHLRATGEVRLDPARVEAVLVRSLGARGLLERLSAPPRWQLLDGDRIEVTVRAVTPTVFGRWSHSPAAREIEVSATARAVVLGLPLDP